MIGDIDRERFMQRDIDGAVGRGPRHRLRQGRGRSQKKKRQQGTSEHGSL
jgi:hypothetical protein